MRNTLRCRWLLVSLLLGATLGCHGSAGTSKPERARKDDADNTWEQIFGVLRARNEASNFPAVIELLNNYVKANPSQVENLRVSGEERGLLKDRWKLDEGEMGEVEGTLYTPLDAAHLEFCFLLRDAARLMQNQVPGAKRPDLARWSFDWVSRQVRFQDEKRDPLPPEFVLRRGQGTALERALVFLALLQQHDIVGCLVGCRDDKNELFLWAAGALVEEKGKRDILLFDPRLGIAIPGPDGVLTLSEIRAQPKLLPVVPSDGAPAYRATPEQAARAEVFVAPPLSALSLRMRHVERQLAEGDPVRLAYDPAKLLARFEAEKAGVWGAGAADAPAQLLRQFLPPDEGGVDKSGRAAWFRIKTVPWFSIRQGFPDLPNIDAQVPVAGHVQKLYEVYDSRPRTLLLRGKLEEATRLLVRIHDEYQAERETHRHNEPVRQKMRQEWASQVRKAYIAQANAKAAGQQGEMKAAQEKIAELFYDPYLEVIKEGKDDIGQMEQDPGNPNQKRQKLKRGLLTAIIFDSTMGSLGADTAYLRALVRQGRAEPLQEQLEHTRSGEARTRAVSAWKNTYKGWDDYLTGYSFTPPEAFKRVAQITRLDPGNDLFLESAVSLLEDLFQDLAMDGQACLLRARALEKAGDVPTAREALTKLPKDLTALEILLDDTLEKGGIFQQLRGRLNQRLGPLEQRPDVKGEPPAYLTRLRHLSRDLAALEQGAWRETVHGLRAAAIARQGQLPAK
jgi:hypothetical protein